MGSTTPSRPAGAPPSNAAILLVGDELLSGHTRDGNGHYLAARLNALGYRVAGMRVSPDDEGAIARDLLGLLEVAPVVLVTGGLGPTHDDRTTDAVAKALGLSLVVDEEALAALARRHERRYGGSFPPHVLAAGRKMATVPQGARPLPNPKGAALGYVATHEPGLVIVLPGVPEEMQAMFEQEVVAKILPARLALHVEEIEVRLPEAEFAETLGRIQRDNPMVTIGSYPTHAVPVTRIRLRGEAALVARVRKEIESLYRDHVVLRTPVERPDGGSAGSN